MDDKRSATEIVEETIFKVLEPGPQYYREILRRLVKANPGATESLLNGHINNLLHQGRIRVEDMQKMLSACSFEIVKGK